MPKLGLEVKRIEQRGPDTFLSLSLSEKDGLKSVSFELTLHNVNAGAINFDDHGGICIWTKEGAPVFVNFGKPAEVIP